MYSVMRLSAVGTPGRVYDTINRKTLRTRDIDIFVLDETDEMLSL